MRSQLTCIACALLTTALAAQKSLAEQQLSRAETTLGQGETQSSESALQSAFWAIHLTKSTKVRRELERRFSKLLRKVDPKLKSLWSSQEKHSRGLQRFLEHFQRQKNQPQVAQIQAQLRAISPLLVGGPVRNGGKPAEMSPIEQWFRGGTTPFDDGTWLTENNLIQSPKIGLDEVWNAILISKQVCKGDFDVQLEIDFTKCVRAGICLGIRGANPKPGAMTLFEIDRAGSQLVVSRLQGNKLILISTRRAEAALAKPFCPIHIQVRGQNCEVRFGAEEKLGFELPEGVDGALGLYASTSRSHPGPARFRSFSQTAVK